jgi:hypothetical protein
LNASRRNAPRGGEHESEGMLGSRHRITLGGVGDDDAALGCGLDVYIVHADAGASYGLEVAGPFYYLGGHLGGAAYDQAVVVRDRIEQLFGG